MLKGMFVSILKLGFLGLVTEDYRDDVYHWVPAFMLKGMKQRRTRISSPPSSRSVSRAS